MGRRQQIEKMVMELGDVVEVKALQSHVKEQMKPITNRVILYSYTLLAVNRTSFCLYTSP